MEVGGVVDAVVVEPAEGDRVFQVCPAAEVPGFSVVELGPGVGPVTAVGEAGGVSGCSPHPLIAKVVMSSGIVSRWIRMPLRRNRS